MLLDQINTELPPKQRVSPIIRLDDYCIPVHKVSVFHRLEGVPTPRVRQGKAETR